MRTPFIELHRAAHPDRMVWINADHIAVIAEEPDAHARVRLCDAMVVDVNETAAEVLDLIRSTDE